VAWPDDIDTSQDFKIWTNTIAVEYLSKTTEALPLTGPTITNVLVNKIRKDRLVAGSILQTMDRTFRIAKAMAQGIVPKIDDIIIDNFGVRWWVKLVEILSFGNEYRVHTIKSPKQNVAAPGVAG